MSLDGGMDTDSPVYRCTKSVVSHVAANSLLLSPRSPKWEGRKRQKELRYGESNPELPRSKSLGVKGGNVSRYTISD
jgi:hypothetical protein